ncbi:hypothetical protein MKW92_000361 [Papaver armeniacum]|nr:hypothetical protein MKW92_000361 [Papaver armeniacum]
MFEKETKDDPNVKVCKWKIYTDVLEKEQRDKCQNCVQLNREIDGLMYEIEGLKNESLELEVQGDLVKQIKGLIEEGIVVFDREMSAQERICHLEEVIKKMETNERERLAELEAYNFKFQGLSAELKQKEMELENLRAVNDGLDRERQDYMTKCIGMEEPIKGLIEEGNVLTQREKSAGERICNLEEAIKKMETNERERLAELEAYNFKFQGLSAELEQKEMELENLREVNGGLDREREREDYMTKCIGMEEQIKGLIEEGNVMSQREKSAGKRICHLEEVVKKMETDERERFTELETRLLKVEEENATLRALQNVVSCERTCRDMDGRVYAANEAHLTRTETSPNSTFTPASCIPSSSLQVNVDGVTASDLAHVNNQCKSAEGGKDYFASAAGHQVGFETEGTLTRFRKCSGIPPSENLALVRQEDGARPSTIGIAEIDSIVEIDSEEEIVDISDDEEEN